MELWNSFETKIPGPISKINSLKMISDFYHINPLSMAKKIDFIILNVIPTTDLATGISSCNSGGGSAKVLDYVLL